MQIESLFNYYLIMAMVIHISSSSKIDLQIQIQTYTVLLTVWIIQKNINNSEDIIEMKYYPFELGSDFFHSLI